MRAALGSRPAAPLQPATDRLFIGIFPDQRTAGDLNALAHNLTIGHELRGRPISAWRLHVTVHHIGDGVGLDAGIVDLAKRAAGDVAMPAFRVAFNSVQSFRNGAFVLCGDEGVTGLEMLQRQIGRLMQNAGLGKAFQDYTPHVTLLRDSHLVPEHPVIPVGWWVREFVLVHSLLGQSRYEILASFPLS
jgi:2'-5' RNA ligase